MLTGGGKVSDAESSGLIATILGSLSGMGLGGWGILKLHTKVSALEAKEEAAKAVQRSAKTVAERHERSIHALEEQGTRTETTMSGMKEDIREMKTGVKKIVDHITGTNLG